MNRRQLLATTGAVASLGLCAGIITGAPGCTPAPAAELPASPTMADMIDRAKAVRQAWSDIGHESETNPSAESEAAFAQAQDDYNAAIEALVRHRPATVEEAGDRLAWLWSFGGPWDGLFPSDEEIALLLASMARG